MVMAIARESYGAASGRAQGGIDPFSDELRESWKLAGVLELENPGKAEMRAGG
jgi:hypothetical protein